MRDLVTIGIGAAQATRLLTGCLIGIAVVLPAVAQGGHWLAAGLSSVPLCLAAMGGFALNDYFDADKDRINNPHRAIPSGRLPAGGALGLALVLLLIAVAAAAWRSRAPAELLLYGVAVAGVCGYNGIVKASGVLKTPYTAACSSIPILYDVTVLGYPGVYWIFPLSTALFIMGRELLMDVRDVRGDREGGIRTLPMVLGDAPAARIGFLLQVAGALLLLPLAASAGRLVLLGLVLGSVGAAERAWWRGAGRYRRQIVRLLWAPMLAGLLLLL